MIAFVIYSQVLYARICKGLARIKGETASHFNVFREFEELHLEKEHSHCHTIAYYSVGNNPHIQAFKEKHDHLFFISLENHEDMNGRWTIYQPFSQLLENLLCLSVNHKEESMTRRIRLCYRLMSQRHKLYEVLFKRVNLHKTLVVDWVPMSKDDVFEGEEEGLLTYHLLNHKPFNIKDFKLIHENNVTVYRPMLYFQDYQYFDVLFPDKINELCAKSGVGLCLSVEHIGFGPLIDLKNQYGYEKQFIFECDGDTIQPASLVINRGDIQISDSWERIFEWIDENR